MYNYSVTRAPYTIAKLLKVSSVITFSELLEICRDKIVITMLTQTKPRETEFIFLKPHIFFSCLLLRFLLTVCRSETVIAKLKQERKICVWSKLLQETLKQLAWGGSVWREHMLQNSTCKMILQWEWNVFWQQIKAGERDREKKGSGRNMNNLKWNWGGNSTESYNAVCSSCAVWFVIAVSFEPSLICPPSMTPSTRLHHRRQQTSKVKSTGS